MRKSMFGLASATAAMVAAAAPAAEMGTGFTYQGHLEKPAGTPVTDTCNFRLGLWDAEVGGNQKGTSPQTINAVGVAAGVFTVTVDFGADAINGAARWLAIEVQCTADGGFVALTPRVELTPAPHALALPALYTQPLTPSAGFPVYSAPNVVGGWRGNAATSGVMGATIAGGGAVNTNTDSDVPNRVTDDWGTVGGGVFNLAGNDVGTTSDAAQATVGGGDDNIAGAHASTVGGGQYNVATGDSSTIGGGDHNTASGDGSTVGGGASNTAATGGGGFTTVGGGYNNTADEDYSTVSGGANNMAVAGFSAVGGGNNNEANAAHGTVGGGTGNIANGQFSTIAGGDFNETQSQSSTIGGGYSNRAYAEWSTIGGGWSNQTTGSKSAVGGGNVNTASGSYATVPGGSLNSAGGNYSFAAGRKAWARSPAGSGDPDGDEGTFVWADSTDAFFTSTGPNQFLIRAGGGVGIGTNDPEAPLHVQEGSAGSVTADANSVAVVENSTHGYLTLLTPSTTERGILFGDDGDNDSGSIVYNPQFGNGTANSMQFRTGGGFTRLVIDTSGKVGIGVGGNTTPLTYPLEVGTDTTNGNGAHLTAGGVWTNGSDRNSKQKFESIDAQEILRKVAELRVTRWQYKGEPAQVRHIGPVAQDFYATFGTGNDERYIGTVDADGVALAAIQGLYDIVREKDCQIEELQSQRSDLASRVAGLEAMMGKVLASHNGGGQ